MSEQYSLRDRAAFRAMQAIVNAEWKATALGVADRPLTPPEAVADHAYEYAHAMLRRRGSEATTDAAPIHVETGVIGDSGLGWMTDRGQNREFERFLSANAGKRIDVTFRVIEEKRDTERPPAFTSDEVDTFEPTVRTLCDEDELPRDSESESRIVGAERFDPPSALRWSAIPAVEGVR